MQKAKIVPKIIYYVFTFLLGIFLVFTMPYFLMYDIVPVKIVEHLEAGEYREALLPVSNLFNSELVYEKHLENGSVIIYETITYGVGEDGKEDQTKIHAIYAGFLYGAEGYKVTATSNNRTKLLIDGIKTVELLDFDNNGDGEYDTHVNAAKGFVYFELGDSLESISRLTFIDKDGNAYIDVDDVSLSFDGEFFADIEPLVTQYNEDYTATDKLTALREEFLSKNSNYAQGSDEEARKIADTKSAIIIVVYFICVYVIADFLLGNRYILKFFRWFIYDACKAKPKKKKTKSNGEIFGHDYYSQVTVSLDLEAVPDFNESVQVRYTNSDTEIAFILLKENGYTETKRIKAGTYVNPFIDVNREFAPVDLPDNLEVEGYRMDVKIKIIKREV